MSKILELAKRIASTGGLETKTTETISGTYDSAGQQRLLSHAYTIGADLTITNGELILSRLADNGTGMTVEFGSDVTLSGDGTLMLGDLGQGQQNFDASKLTGVLGSGVTIPAAGVTGTLGSGIFPTGHVVQIVQNVIRDNWSSSNSSYTITDTIGYITPSSTSNKVLVSIVSVLDTGAAGRTPTLMLYRNGSAVSSANEGLMQAKATSGGIRIPFTINWLDSPGSTSEVTYALYAKDNGGGTIECPPYASMDHTITMLEIKG